MIEETIDTVLEKLRFGGYYTEAIMNLPLEDRKFVETTSWAGEAHQKEIRNLARAEIMAAIQSEQTEDFVGDYVECETCSPEYRHCLKCERHREK